MTEEDTMTIFEQMKTMTRTLMDVSASMHAMQQALTMISHPMMEVRPTAAMSLTLDQVALLKADPRRQYMQVLEQEAVPTREQMVWAILTGSGPACYVDRGDCGAGESCSCKKRIDAVMALLGEKS